MGVLGDYGGYIPSPFQLGAGVDYDIIGYGETVAL
jgi:hypothetical protein